MGTVGSVAPSGSAGAGVQGRAVGRLPGGALALGAHSLLFPPPCPLPGLRGPAAATPTTPFSASILCHACLCSWRKACA